MKHLFIVLSSLLLFTGTAAAATSDKTPKTPPVKTKPADVQAKPATPVKPAPTKESLDQFFEDGAEQAKEGSTCRKPPAPIV